MKEENLQERENIRRQKKYVTEMSCYPIGIYVKRKSLRAPATQNTHTKSWA